MCLLYRAHLCAVLPYSGITRYLWYYYGIRLPRCLLASSVCCVVGHTLYKRERRGSPELPLILCASCLALRPRSGIRSLTIALTNMLPSVISKTSAHIVLKNFEAQSLSGLMPNCQRLNMSITAHVP